jgi:thioredoxin reductase (NADPH)
MTDAETDEQFYRDTESIAFPKLDDRQLGMLEPLGSRRIVRRGELIFHAGKRDLPLIVVLRGELEVFEPRDGQEQILANPGPRDFVGEVGMLTGTAALASGRGKADESEILEVPAARLRQALAELPGRGPSRSCALSSCGGAGWSGTRNSQDCGLSRRTARARAANSTTSSTRITSRTG